MPTPRRLVRSLTAPAPPDETLPLMLGVWQRTYASLGGSFHEAVAIFRDYEFAARFLKDTPLFPQDDASRWFEPTQFHQDNSDLADRSARLIIRRFRESAKCVSRRYYETVQDRLELSVTDSGAIVPDDYVTTDSPVEPVYAVRTRSGREVVVNAKHPFLTWRGDWLTIDGGLGVGDWVGVLRRGQFGDPPGWLDATPGMRGSKTSTRLMGTPDLAYLVGWMLADGNLATQQVSITDSDERKEFIATASAVGLGTLERARYVRIHGLRAFWREWGLAGAKSAQKFVPRWILRADQAIVSACLRGLFKDATRPRASVKRHVYTTTSPRLADDVQHLLAKFGLYSRRAHRTGLYQGRPYPYWTVDVTDTLGLFGNPILLERDSVSDRFPPEWRHMLTLEERWRLAAGGLYLGEPHMATSRAKVRRVALALGHRELLAACDSDLGWEPIVAIEPRGDDRIVSIQTGHETLTLGDLVTHNSTQYTVIRPIRKVCENRNIRIVVISKTQVMAAKFVGVVANQLETNRRLIDTYGLFRSQDEPWTATAFKVIRTAAYGEPTMQAVGRGGQIVSGRYELVILDDVEDYDSTRTEERRRATYEWFQRDVVPTIVAGGQGLIIQTPQHEHDLVGQVTAKHRVWRVITVPSESDAPEHPGGPRGRVSSWPEKFPIYWQSTAQGRDSPCDVERAERRGASWDALAQVANTACDACLVYNPEPGGPSTNGVHCLTGKRLHEVGEAFYGLQYLCSITALGGQIFQAAWFTRWRRSHLTWAQGKWSYQSAEMPRPLPLRVRIGIDPAIADEEERDPGHRSRFALVVLGYLPSLRRRIIMHYENQRLTWPEQLEVAQEQILTWQPEEVIVEKVGYQKALKQALTALRFPVIGQAQDTDWFRRIAVLAPEIRAGNVSVLESDGGECLMDELVHQFTQFPRGTFDDLLDAYDLAQRGLETQRKMLQDYSEAAHAQAQAARPEDSPHVIVPPASEKLWTVAETLRGGRGMQF